MGSSADPSFTSILRTLALAFAVFANTSLAFVLKTKVRPIEEISCTFQDSICSWYSKGGTKDSCVRWKLANTTTDPDIPFKEGNGFLILRNTEDMSKTKMDILWSPPFTWSLPRVTLTMMLFCNDDTEFEVHLLNHDDDDHVHAHFGTIECRIKGTWNNISISLEQYLDNEYTQQFQVTLIGMVKRSPLALKNLVFVSECPPSTTTAVSQTSSVVPSTRPSDSATSTTTPLIKTTKTICTCASGTVLVSSSSTLTESSSTGPPASTTGKFTKNTEESLSSPSSTSLTETAATTTSTVPSSTDTSSSNDIVSVSSSPKTLHTPSVEASSTDRRDSTTYSHPFETASHSSPFSRKSTMVSSTENTFTSSSLRHTRTEPVKTNSATTTTIIPSEKITDSPTSNPSTPYSTIDVSETSQRTSSIMSTTSSTETTSPTWSTNGHSKDLESTPVFTTTFSKVYSESITPRPQTVPWSEISSTPRPHTTAPWSKETSKLTTTTRVELTSPTDSVSITWRITTDDDITASTTTEHPETSSPESTIVNRPPLETWELVLVVSIACAFVCGVLIVIIGKRIGRRKGEKYRVNRLLSVSSKLKQKAKEEFEMSAMNKVARTRL